MKQYTTEYLKQVWDLMGGKDGVYGDFIVEDMGHIVNGLFMDDVYYELQERGEGKYVAV